MPHATVQMLQALVFPAKVSTPLLGCGARSEVEQSSYLLWSAALPPAGGKICGGRRGLEIMLCLFP